MGDGWGGASTVALQPIQASRRHPADYRDELEHAEVVRILSGMDEQGRPARL